jgi:hypothetical protein
MACFRYSSLHRLGGVFLERFLARDALPGRRPHVGDVKILGAVVVVIEPATLMPAPVSSTPASAATSVNVPLPLLR